METTNDFSQILDRYIHDGKINQNYASEVINSRYEYVLLERKL